MAIKTANTQQNTAFFQAVTGSALVYQIRVSGVVPSGCFLMVFDEVPAEPPYNYVPVASQALEHGVPMDFGVEGRPFVTGVYVAISGRADYLAPPNMSTQAVAFDVIYE